MNAVGIDQKYACWNRYMDFNEAMACAIRKTAKDSIRRAVRVQHAHGANLYSVVEVQS